MAHLEEEMRRGEWGGVRLKGEKIYTLAYADDVMLLAEEEDDIRAMVARLERYVRKKGLEVNARRSKIMKFKRDGERKKVRWRWERRGKGDPGIQIPGVYISKQRGTGEAG